MIAVVYYAYYTKKQFYPAILFLVSSKASYIVVGNLLLALSLFIARIFKSIFFGQLRDSEVELLIEKAKYVIPETCLALTIFRSELSPFVLALFGALIFIKLLHRLSKFRLEYLEQLMPIPITSQVRVAFLLTFLAALDISGALFSFMYISKFGRSVIILFGFEFGLLLIYAINLTARFIIQMRDSLADNGLSQKGLYLMLTDLICEGTKFVIYFCFFCLIFMHYGVPIHIMRDVWSAYLSFKHKLVSFMHYLKLNNNLNNRFVDATPEELRVAGNCLVCREDLDQNGGGKKLPCGHIFHLECLRLWLQHQQTCPLCRLEILKQQQQQLKLGHVKILLT